MNPLSWLYQQWVTTPAPIREPIRSAFVSASLSFGTVTATDFGFAVKDGALGSPLILWSYMASHAWGCFIGFLIGATGASTYRAMQAKVRVANTISLSDGTTAVITKAGTP